MSKDHVLRPSSDVSSVTAGADSPHNDPDAPIGYIHKAHQNKLRRRSFTVDSPDWEKRSTPTAADLEASRGHRTMTPRWGVWMLLLAAGAMTVIPLAVNLLRRGTVLTPTTLGAAAVAGLVAGTVTAVVLRQRDAVAGWVFTFSTGAFLLVLATTLVL